MTEFDRLVKKAFGPEAQLYMGLTADTPDYFVVNAEDNQPHRFDGPGELILEMQSRGLTSKEGNTVALELPLSEDGSEPWA